MDQTAEEVMKCKKAGDDESI